MRYGPPLIDVRQTSSPPPPPPAAIRRYKVSYYSHGSLLGTWIAKGFVRNPEVRQHWVFWDESGKEVKLYNGEVVIEEL